MRRRVRWAGIGLFALVAGAQLFRVERTNPPVVSDVDAPPEVRTVLRRACYDCHSHETAWPWYSRVAPVSWLVAHDVHHGRRELDFSTWDAYPRARKVKKLKKIADEVAEGGMPLWYYLPMHRAARLDAADREAIRRWTGSEAARLAP